MDDVEEVHGEEASVKVGHEGDFTGCFIGEWVSEDEEDGGCVFKPATGSDQE